MLLDKDQFLLGHFLHSGSHELSLQHGRFLSSVDIYDNL